MKRHCCLIVICAFSSFTVGCMTPWAGTAFPSLPGSDASTVSNKSAPSPIDLPPKDGAEVCIKLGESMAKTGFPADAAAQYEKARQLDPKLDVSHRLAVLYDQLGEKTKSDAEYRIALKRSPRDADLLNDYGYGLYGRGQWAEAEVQFRAALAQKKDHNRAWVNLGMALAQQGKYQEGFDAFTKAIRPAEAHANLGFIYMTQGKQSEAQQEYRKALSLDSNLQVARAALRSMDNPNRAANKPASTKPAQPLATAPFHESNSPAELPPIGIGRPVYPAGS